jgi:hypothetical protein
MSTPRNRTPSIAAPNALGSLLPDSLKPRRGRRLLRVVLLPALLALDLAIDRLDRKPSTRSIHLRVDHS